MPANTSAASASCGTHFGLTKLVASIVFSPVSDRRSISAILSRVAMIAFSFCRPSRAPTSTMRTYAGKATSRLQRHQHGIGLDEVAFGGAHFGDGAVARRFQAQFHLHRFEHQQLLSCGHCIAGARLDQYYPARHRCRNPVFPRGIRRTFATIHLYRFQSKATLAVMHGDAARVLVDLETAAAAVDAHAQLAVG